MQQSIQTLAATVVAALTHIESSIHSLCASPASGNRFVLRLAHEHSEHQTQVPSESSLCAGAQVARNAQVAQFLGYSEGSGAQFVQIGH